MCTAFPGVERCRSAPDDAKRNVSLETWRPRASGRGAFTSRVVSFGYLRGGGGMNFRATRNTSPPPWTPTKGNIDTRQIIFLFSGSQSFWFRVSSSGADARLRLNPPPTTTTTDGWR